MPAMQHLRPVVISAPFGNYVQPAGTTPTLGTFTAEARSGRAWRILKTVRYYRRLGAWVNKIGLRNPGIDWLAAKVDRGKIDVADKLISIHGFTPDDWHTLLEKVAALRPLGVELNMSCPNVGEIDWPPDLFADALSAANAAGSLLIVKIPPVNWRLMVEAAAGAGVTHFHACNTLPVPAGGMSGLPLKPLALRVVGDLRTQHGDALALIGGGGITTPADVEAYRQAGADHVALGTKLMHPKYLWTHRDVQPLIERAESWQSAEQADADAAGRVDPPRKAITTTGGRVA